MLSEFGSMTRIGLNLNFQLLNSSGSAIPNHEDTSYGHEGVYSMAPTNIPSGTQL